MAPRTPRAAAGGDDDLIEAEPAAAPHRSARQRFLLGLGIVLSLAAIAAAATVGWAAWKYHQIDRTDVTLDGSAGDGPENYLIVGSDTRADGDPNDPHAVVDHKPLADTIMIMRIDASTKQAKVLSLPRDLWVHLAHTTGEGRINAAYAGGGPQRLVDTLKDELDISINHYVEVDFQGFQKMVTAVGGVPMWFDRAMRDRNSGLDVLHPGCTTLDGDGALAFARARHLEYFSHGTFAYDGTGDLGRISRQQLFIRRLIDRAKSKGIRNPLTLKGFVDAAISAVRIDKGLSVGDLVSLARRFSNFDSSSLVSYTLPTSPRVTKGGADVLDLSVVKAQPILDLFRAPGDAKAGRETASTVPAADVKLSVLNSSGRQGLAVTVADDLVAHGFSVDHWGNGAELRHPSEAHTTIRYAPGTDAEAVLLAAKVDGGVVLAKDPSLHDAVVLYLGADYTSFGHGGGPITAASTTTGGASGSTTTAPTTPHGSSATTTTTVPASPVVGMVPGDPPPGRSCG